MVFAVGRADEAGDFVVVLVQEKDDRFERVGDNLIIDQAVSLRTALCGGRITAK